MKDEKEYLRRHWILWNWLAKHSGTIFQAVGEDIDVYR